MEYLQRERSPLQTKVLIVMKLMLVFILFFTFNLSATGYGQQKINIKVKNMIVSEVLTSIEKQTSYRFLYNNDLSALKNTVTIRAKDAEVNDVLPLLLSGTALTYQTMGNNLIVIKEDPNVAKDVVVSGQVLDDKGAPVQGASVQVKGTTIGTTTNAEGNFTISVPNANSILVITSVGFNAQEYPLNGQTNVTLAMTASQQVMDQVVVIGYGTAAKRDLTGSIAKVKGEEIAAQPNANPLASLQSKVAGLNIINTAIPGDAPDVRIRGTISIGTIRPIYIVDGVFSDNMDFVNPNEIESIEILKDPSSLAIFGIKGAAGAILVTTKKAKAGQTLINFSTTYGTKRLVDKIQLANGDQFRTLATREANSQGNGSLLSFVNDPNGLAKYTGNTDWIDAVTRVAHYRTINLGVDGSTEKNKFHMGVGYSGDEGLVKYVKYDRLTVNLNDEYKINKTWKIGFGVIGSRENLPYNSGALENSRRSLPIVPSQTKSFRTKNPYGIDSANYDLYSSTPIIQNSETNPLATLEYNHDKLIDTRYRIVGNAFVDINITKDLNFRSTLYSNLSFRTRREYTPLYDLYDPANESNPIIHKNSLTAVGQENINTKEFQQDHILTYKKRFGDHGLTAMGGVTSYYNNYQSLKGNISQKQVGYSIIPDDQRFWYISTGFGDASTRQSTSGQHEYSTLSGLARVLYNFKSKYFLNASFRRDGASQINREYSKKWQNFWAVGAAWEMGKESFMQNQEFINSLKLKASTGLLGNFTAQGRDYPAYPTISSSSSAVFGDNLVPVYVKDYEFDPNLHWETVKSSEVGLEASALENRLYFEANYYYKKTDGLIVLLDQPSGLRKLTNSGSIKNSGLEFTATWNDKIGIDWSYSLGGNLTTYKNKVLYLPSAVRPNISSSEQTPNQTQTGYPIGYFYGLVADGIYQSYADILASPVNTINGGGAKPGDMKYKDINSDGKIDDKDRTMIGNPTPDFTYGLNAGLRYKAFDFSADFAGSYGAEIYRVWGTSEQKNSVYNYPAYYMDGWTGAGTSNWVPIVDQTHLINRAPSTYGIEDGSYFRIRNMSVGYTFSKSPKVNFFKNIRLSVGVQNLKTWKHNLGYSPEFSGDALTYGIDYGSASSALPRIFTFGLNANF